MAIGLRNAGFRKSLVFERDSYAYATLKNNGLVGEACDGWEDHNGDVRKVQWCKLGRRITLLAGGVPCQPFSLAGRHAAQDDSRDMFPEFLRAARSLRPKAMFVENVFGLTRESFQPYFQYILRQMQCPSLEPLPDESWELHDARLRRHQAANGYLQEYYVEARTLNAADYGVPQVRKRVFIVATCRTISRYSFPEATHSRCALRRSMESGDYWDRHGIKRPEMNGQTRMDLKDDGKLPWRTVRDAIADLPAPAYSDDTAARQHWLIPGARSYRGHTGSLLDEPSKTLKAGVNGVPGGENTVIGDDGQIRYYTFREAARIQTFPDCHVFHGARKHITRQIGNAVPCLLAEVLALPLYQILTNQQMAALTENGKT
jgi:DNA (cytosine-5)-methyltransferase 1